MKQSTHMSLFVLCWWTFGGCASSPKPERETYNPMPGIWNSTVNEIATLKKIKATRAQWTAAADGREPLRTAEQFRTEISYMGTLKDEDPQKRDARLERLFQSAQSTVLFWWEGNFKVIVFFDARGHQVDVY